MDIKWKRFSRNGVVRMLCNMLLIVCIVLGAVFVNQIAVYRIKYTDYINQKSQPYELFGNTKFQEEIKERLKQVLTCMMAEAQEAENAERLKRELDNTLEGMYDYNIVYADREGTQHVLSNSDGEDISEDIIQVKYQGSIHGDTYERAWDNVYYGTISYLDEQEKYHSLDFEWLNVGELMQEISQENPSYGEAITKDLVDHLELYKDTLQTFLCYLATKENVPGYTAVEKSTYYKIYGSYPDLKVVIEQEYLLDWEYDETTGLYKDDTGMYYDPQEDEWYDLQSDLERYEKYCSDMSKKMEGIRKALEQEDVQKTEDNVFQLTKAEKENLLQNIATSLKNGYYTENPAQYEEDAEGSALEVSFSFSAMLNSPASYSINFGVKSDYVYTQLEQEYVSWNEARDKAVQAYQKMDAYVMYLVINAVCAGILVLFLCYVCGRKADTEEVQLLFFDYWKTEVMLVIGIVIAMCILFGEESIGNSMWSSDMRSFRFLLAAMGFGLWLLLQILFSLVRRIKAKTLYTNSILALLMGRMQGMANQGTLNRKVTLTMAAVLGLWILLEYITIVEVEQWNMGEVVLLQCLMIGIGLLVFAYVNRVVRKLSIIIEGVKRIRGGDLNYQIPTDGKEDHLNRLAQDINSLSDGLGNAVDDMLRSERLKTELISNVSHDIKTPLTSIITYVDLLKREDIRPEKAKEYVDVLEQKSQRLKVLTDDLFEAAKASSGTMATEITKIDIGALVCQAAGEFSEKFEKSELELRNSIQDDVWYVQADGKLAWRIVENLFSNATKYAQPNSRVYVDAEQKEQMIEIVVKNVSAYELNISAAELMERFTRGDKSRNTEGSGLGLNIAKSLAELQGGRFFVEIDGDLFKAVLQLPMAQ